MRTPKPPLGFVPVDSEEAMWIDADQMVNYAYRAECDAWWYSFTRISNIRRFHSASPESYYHVQLPQPVEWEEVWEWREFNHTVQLLKNGEWQRLDSLENHELDTIVRALNEMEVENG